MFRPITGEQNGWRVFKRPGRCEENASNQTVPRRGERAGGV